MAERNARRMNRLTDAPKDQTKPEQAVFVIRVHRIRSDLLLCVSACFCKFFFFLCVCVCVCVVVVLTKKESMHCLVGTGRSIFQGIARWAGAGGQT